MILGTGYVANYFAVGLERIKLGEIKPYGVPLADLDMDIDIKDVQIVACVDVDSRKVGKSVYDVAKEFYQFNNVPRTLKRVKVMPGIELGLVKDLFPIKSLDSQMDLLSSIEEMYRMIKDVRPDVIVDVTTTQYASPFGTYDRLETAIEQGNGFTPTQLYAYLALRYMKEVEPIAYINLIPTPIANDLAYVTTAKKFGGLVLGDDGATGATPFTADILEHLKERNRKVLGIAQLNIGGNADFMALLNERRNRAKEITKSSIVEDILGYDAPHYIRPTGFLESLGDKKFVAIHIEYVSFNGARDEIIVNMRINDSPALAGYIVDLVRIAKIALERGIYGTIYDVNAFYMKKPGPPGSKNLSRIVAYQKLVSFVKSMIEAETRSVALAETINERTIEEITD